MTRPGDATEEPLGAVEEQLLDFTFASRQTVDPVPKYKLPEHGMPAAVAKQLIEDERQLDSNPRQNLASFVTTWMEPEARDVMMAAQNVNIIDLYHSPSVGPEACGTATIGSSEAIMLATLAMKFRWADKRKMKGLSTSSPNFVMGRNTQVCWEKACRYFEIEARCVSLEEDSYVMTPSGALALVDENTIGVCAILGSTYNGEFEDVKGLCALLEAKNAEKGWDVRVHVDGASGAFVAPFLYPELEWDFRLPLVCSINVSGHKYGLVYPGLGWLIFRSKAELPERLVFKTNYLGSEQLNFTLNFSKSASPIVGQYYMLLRLGREGYTRVFENLARVAKHFADGVEALGCFTLLSKDGALPLVAFRVSPPKSGELPRRWDEFYLADKLRERGWVLPAYRFAPNAEHIKLVRAVIREDMSMAMCDALLRDLSRAVAFLDAHFVPVPPAALQAAAALEKGAAVATPPPGGPQGTAPAGAAAAAAAVAHVAEAVVAQKAHTDKHHAGRRHHSHPAVC